MLSNMEIDSIISEMNGLNITSDVHHNKKQRCIYKFQKGSNKGKICKRKTKDLNNFFCVPHSKRISCWKIQKEYLEHRKLFIEVFGDSETDSDADTVEWND